MTTSWSPVTLKDIKEEKNDAEVLTRCGRGTHRAQSLTVPMGCCPSAGHPLTTLTAHPLGETCSHQALGSNGVVGGW